MTVFEVYGVVGYKVCYTVVAVLQGDLETQEIHLDYWNYSDETRLFLKSLLISAVEHWIVGSQKHSHLAAAAKKQNFIIFSFSGLNFSRITDSWAFSIGLLFCCKFILMFAAEDCEFQFWLVWACAVDCVKEDCLGDNWDELLFELLVCWKLLIICGFICCWWGESRWMLFILNILCWKSAKKFQKL